MVSLQKIDQTLPLTEREATINSISNHSLNEGVFLQTCNRVELYSGGGHIPQNIISHLFRVVSGLESSLVGETSISQGAVSHSQAAVNIICRSFQEICNSRITVVGVHNINENIIKYLTKKGARTIFIGTRTMIRQRPSQSGAVAGLSDLMN